MKTRITGAMAGLIAILAASSASAVCRISNQTSYSFVVSSGSTANQTVAPHASATIAAGKIVGKSKDGKTIGGSCKDGDELVVKEEQGVPLIVPK